MTDRLTPKDRNRLWNTKIRPQLKKQFEALGLTRCEICRSAFGLSFAHSRKRRNITTVDLLEEVILACASCHHEIEMLGEERMCLRVIEVIKNRCHQPS